VAKGLEAELGDDQPGFIEGDPSAWDLLPVPEGTFIVGIDGGYVRNWSDNGPDKNQAAIAPYVLSSS
jgi:hypothetical protein